MSHTKIFLDYSGPVNQIIIDNILQNLKNKVEFQNLSKVTGMRIYAIVVECLENIAKHTRGGVGDKNGRQPYISAGEWNDMISILSGNPVLHEKTAMLAARIDKVNGMERGELLNLYEHILNGETKLTENGGGAGLGFILMKLKSTRNIGYTFTRIDSNYSFFEIQISVNKHTMRKLVIDKTVNSPRVMFDPENNRFEISGESRPSDVASFYLEILRWFDEYSSNLGKTQEKNDPAVFNFDFEYFNSSSAKYILDFCKQIGDARSKGKNLSIRWHYDKDDLDMFQVGQEMEKISKTPFEFISKNFE